MRARSSTKDMVLAAAVPLCNGATYSTNRRGDMGDPWGVPTATFLKEFGAPWKRRRHDLSVRKVLIYAIIYGESPFSLSIPVRRAGLTLSKPPLMSKKREEALSFSLCAVATS